MKDRNDEKGVFPVRIKLERVVERLEIAPRWLTTTKKLASPSAGRLGWPTSKTTVQLVFFNVKMRAEDVLCI